MKTLLLCVAVFCATASFSTAQDEFNYARRVALYSDNAAQSIRDIRQEVRAVAAETTLIPQTRLDPVYAAITRCENLLAAVKIATVYEYDTRKAEFEAAREELVRLWKDTRPAPAPSGTVVVP